MNHNRRCEDIPVDYAKHRYIDYVPMNRGQGAVVSFCVAIIVITLILWAAGRIFDLILGAL